MLDITNLVAEMEVAWAFISDVEEEGDCALRQDKAGLVEILLFKAEGSQSALVEYLLLTCECLVHA